MTNTTYQQLGSQIGELTDRKNAAYGSSFAKCGDFLRLLYPNGIAPRQMEDALLLVRIFDKQMRIATDQDAFGESPFEDIAGYGLLGARLHKERRATCPGSASDQNAKTPSSETPDFAAPNTSPTITTNVRTLPEVLPEPNPSQPRSSSSAQPGSVLVSTAMEAVSPSVASLAHYRNNEGTCGCGCGLSRYAECRVINYNGDRTLLFASHHCLLRFLAESAA